MAEDEDSKRRIVNELAEARLGLATSAATVRGRLDIPARLSASFRRNSWSWVSIAAIVGWVLARLPFRRKKIYLEAGSHRRLKGDGKQAGRKRDLAWMIWDGVWSLAKPLLTAYLGRKLAQTTGNPDWRKP
ncbi:MAG TPA: hypothetical protein VFO40_14475 [Chthoniobacterales bacterium]|nr:hypothetical protein [Chthoniobacterales bacterium]